MTRRSFLQSVIAVPLVAVGMPQARAVTTYPGQLYVAEPVRFRNATIALSEALSDAWREALSAPAAEYPQRVEVLARAFRAGRFLPNG